MLLQVVPFLLAVSVAYGIAPYGASYHGDYQVVQPQYHSAPQAHYVAVPQQQYHAAPQERYHAVPQTQYYAAPVSHYQAAPQPQYYVAPQEQHAQSHGNKYDDQGYQSSGHHVSGHGQYGAHGQGASRAFNAHATNDAAGYGAKAVQSAQDHHQGQYRNVGSYSHDKGSGYEKSYSFDKAEGHHEITDDHVSQSAKHAASSKEGHHNVASKAVQEQAKHGAHGKSAAYANSKQGHDKSVFDKYGYSQGGHKQGYSYSPVYGYGYH